ncbi:hypothetical protein C0991_011957 [Blastosporella zonata]|nr:hypothetical protein C0991_011957 [Blastosporella zonata]
MPPPSQDPSLHLSVETGSYFVVQVPNGETLPPWVFESLATGNFFSVTRTTDEISVVGQLWQGIPEEVQKLSTWSCIKIAGPMEHTSGHTRQKRVLPSRARRGPGVGNCETDVMILETQRRRPENEPLIPADTPFLLTTNPTLASTLSSSYQVNVYANERYFERPEVLKAYREQLVIETPEFKSLGDTPVTVGRLRARSSAGINGDGPVETSDAVYEKRHRKYETFEKRFRLREKEKLKHEQYKLKERIEQLRAMDPSAFLALPDDLFPAPFTPPDEEPHDEEVAIFGAPLNSGPNHIEGERRRREMLKIASTIEDRFRVLLPPREDKRKPPITLEPSVEPEFPIQVGKAAFVPPDAAPLIETVPKGIERLKLKINFGNTKTTSSKHTPSKKRRESAPPPKEPPIQELPAALEELVSQVSSPIDLVAKDLPSQISHTQPIPPSYHSFTSPPPRSMSLPATPLSNPEIAFLQPEGYSPTTADVHDGERCTSTDFQESMSAVSRPSVSRPYKRIKLSPTSTSPSFRSPSRALSIPPISSISAQPRHRSPSHASTVQSSRRHGSYGGPPEYARQPPQHGLLMTQAIRSSSNKASKGQRHLYAFGGKVQNELFAEERDFELPHWIHLVPLHESLKKSHVRKTVGADEFSKASPALQNARELSVQ